LDAEDQPLVAEADATMYLQDTSDQRLP